MLRFDLPVVRVKSSVHQALASAIEAGKGGVLVRGGCGKLRVVQFGALVEAATSGKRLASLPGEPIMKLQGQFTTRPGVMTEAGIFTVQTEIEDLLDEAGRKFGLIALGPGLAQLVSRHEGYGGVYASPPTGVRCQRPQRPPNTPMRAWFHYYPPNDRNPKSPHVCVLCGAPVP
jgi:hypothetical protein